MDSFFSSWSSLTFICLNPNPSSSYLIVITKKHCIDSSYIKQNDPSASKSRMKLYGHFGTINLHWWIRILQHLLCNINISICHSNQSKYNDMMQTFDTQFTLYCISKNSKSSSYCQLYLYRSRITFIFLHFCVKMNDDNYNNGLLW